MTISQIAIRRIAEDKAAEDETYRRQLQQNGRLLSCQVREMSDDQLVAKLQTMGLEIDRVTLDRESQAYLAAYQLANTLLDQRASATVRRRTQDRAWFAIETLWRCRFPERSNLEIVDDCMQEGYAAAGDKIGPTACRQWRQAWLAILDLMQRFRIETIADFDEQFGGTQSVFNWVQDYESELHNAGLDDPQFFQERIALCQAAIERLGDEELTIQNLRTPWQRRTSSWASATSVIVSFASGSLTIHNGDGGGSAGRTATSFSHRDPRTPIVHFRYSVKVWRWPGSVITSSSCHGSSLSWRKRDARMRRPMSTGSGSKRKRMSRTVAATRRARRRDRAAKTSSAIAGVWAATTSALAAAARSTRSVAAGANERYKLPPSTRPKPPGTAH